MDLKEDESKSVKVRNNDVTIKTITIEDGSAKAKITLWRNLANTTVRPGDYVTITDLVTNVFNSVTTLQTTSLSTVLKCEAPMETKTVEVDAIGVTDGDEADLYISNGDMITVSTNILQKALNLDNKDDVELATSTDSITLQINMSGNETIDIKLIKTNEEC